MHTIGRSGAGKLFASLLCTVSVMACGPAPEAGKPEAGQETAPTGTTEQPVVYGTDNRTDVYAHANATLRQRAEKSTVALMSPSDYTVGSNGTVTFNAPTLGSAYGLCSNQRFLSDLTPAFCSGTLIDDDLVLTAGHCITSASACSSTRVVFNFYRTSATGMQTVTSADIFSCTSIVVRQQTSGTPNLDYAIIKLDRAATPRFEPAPIRAGNAALAVGSRVTVIGSGSGIPFKIDDGGSVRDARAGTLDYFVATTDTFGGNSGSGVYENTGYTVAGILVRGETDYVTSGSCRIVNTCTETGCRGEDITYVRPAVNAYCNVAGSLRLCGTTNPPPTTTFAFTATNTANATVNTTDKTVTLAAGQTLQFGTCTLPGASGSGDTYLRLTNSAGTSVASNDDSCSLLSFVSYTAPTAGTYTMRAGCYSSNSCSGTVAYTIQ
ncbi:MULTISPECIES: trypsin-like peptidase domain-containing protein [Myxococcus]|uniref:trypsin-like peptidase domain-containing protein n=1 Tax=Myxococcus TaxID=32 RepID=UPI0013D546AB|nr:trypsin-like peptidase domain-containing protein [Myxococcus sp. AM011]